MEMISLDQSGNRLRAVGIDGRVILDQRVTNHGNWGTPQLCTIDVDDDGRQEIVVPSLAPRSKFEAWIVAINAEGKGITSCSFGVSGHDDYGIAVPLVQPVALRPNG